MKVSVRDLKDSLSAYLKQVQHGEEMIVTSHERPIARIIPITGEANILKISRGNWLKKIRSLHASLGKLKFQEPMSKTVISSRKKERY